MDRKNKHNRLDAMKLRLSCEVLAQFSLAAIRAHARANLLRWKNQGSWGPAYDEWLRIIESTEDSLLISCMVGLDENSNRLRQSIPYVGMLNQEVVMSIKAEFMRGKDCEKNGCL
jgi:hypothetical protein